MKKMFMVALLAIVSSFAFAGIEDRIVGAWNYKKQLTED